MATERMVTRTVENCEANCLVVKKSTREVMEKNFSIPVSVPEEKRLKYIGKYLLEEDYAVVSILDTKITSILYGMLEVDFIKFARILPPRSIKED